MQVSVSDFPLPGGPIMRVKRERRDLRRAEAWLGVGQTERMDVPGRSKFRG